MSKTQAAIANDAVCKLVQNGDLTRSLNTLRTEPSAPNPFVVNHSATTSQQSVNTGTHNSPTRAEQQK